MGRHKNAAQDAVFLNFIKKHSNFARGSLRGNKLRYEAQWNDLVEELNAQGPPEKSLVSWKKVWLDWKASISKKVAHNNAVGAQGTESGRFHTHALSQMEDAIARAAGIYANFESKNKSINEASVAVVEEVEGEDSLGLDAICDDESKPNTIDQKVSASHSFPLGRTHKNAAQEEVLLKFIKQHPNFGTGSVIDGDRTTSEMLWNEVAKELNEHGPPEKNVDSWKKVWKDWRATIRKKLEHNNALAAQGNESNRFDMRVLSQMEDAVAKASGMYKELSGKTKASFCGSVADDEASLGLDGLSEDGAESKMSLIYPSKLERTRKNHAQGELLLNFMKEHPNLGRGFIRENKTSVNALWNELAEKLNGLGPPQKSVVLWKKVWLDWRAAIRKKIQHNNAVDAQGSECEGIDFRVLSPMEDDVARVSGIYDDLEGKTKSSICNSIVEVDESDGEKSSSSDDLSEIERDQEQLLANMPFNHRFTLRQRNIPLHHRFNLKRTHKNYAQEVVLLNFMRKHPNFVNGFVKGDKITSENLWNEVAKQLNSQGPPVKIVGSWRKVWVDWRSSIRKKIEHNNAIAARGNEHERFDVRALTQMEDNIAKVSGIYEELKRKALSKSTSTLTDIDEDEVCLGFDVRSDNDLDLKLGNVPISLGDRSKRTSKNYAQQTIILNFMKEHPYMSRGSIKGDIIKSNALWTELTTTLNDHGPPVKSVEVWKKVYQLWRSSIKHKIEHNNAVTARGNECNLLDIRVLSQIEDEIARASGIYDDLEGKQKPSLFGVSTDIEDNENEDSLDRKAISENGGEQKMAYQKASLSHKTGRTHKNAAQSIILLNFMKQHPHFSRGYIKGDRITTNNLWDKLIKILNSRGPPEKPVGAWRKVWLDWRLTIRKKIEHNNAIAALGSEQVLLPLEAAIAKVSGIYEELKEKTNSNTDKVTDIDEAEDELSLGLDAENDENDGEPNAAQEAVFLNFMKQHPNITRGFIKGDIVTSIALWNELTTELNGHGPPEKNVGSWKKIWLDWRTVIIKKLEHNNAIAALGSERLLSQMEEDVAKVSRIYDDLDGQPNGDESEDEEVSLGNESISQNKEELTPLNRLCSLSSSSKRKRTHKNAAQGAVFVNFMNQHQNLRRGFIKEDRITSNALWKELVEQLNAIGPPEKSVGLWKKVWLDWRLTIRKKIEHNNAVRAREGECEPKDIRELSHMEDAVARVSGIYDDFEGKAKSSTCGSVTDVDECQDEASLGLDAISENEDDPLANMSSASDENETKYNPSWQDNFMHILSDQTAVISSISDNVKNNLKTTKSVENNLNKICESIDNLAKAIFEHTKETKRHNERMEKYQEDILQLKRRRNE